MIGHRPNFCYSECAGRVLVAILSPQRRIAERFRYGRGDTRQPLSGLVNFLHTSPG